MAQLHERQGGLPVGHRAVGMLAVGRPCLLHGTDTREGC